LLSTADQLAAAETAALEGQVVADKTIGSGAATTESASAKSQQAEPSDPTATKSNDKTSAASATESADRAPSAALNAQSPSPNANAATSPATANATAATAAKSAQSAQDLANRVADSLRTGFESGGELRVRLEPPALGKVQIEVQADSGSVSARLEVQTPAARQTLLDNISLLHDAIGQAGATVNRIDIEVVPQQHQDSNGSDSRDSNSGARQDSGQSGSQNQSNNSNAGSGQQQKSRWRRTAAIDAIDIEV
jgi:flagellar hook-length control protein FliK